MGIDKTKLDLLFILHAKRNEAGPDPVSSSGETAQILSLKSLEERVKRIEGKLGIPFDEISKNGDITGAGASAAPFRQSLNEEESSTTRPEVEGMQFESAILGPTESKLEQETVEEEDSDMAVFETYQQVGAGLMPNLSVLALVCVVFALSKYFASSTSAFQGSDTSRDKSHQEYVEMASRALAETGHLENPTIESIQAVLLAGTCLLGNTGAIRSARVLAAAMYMSAQALSLHQVDSPKNKRLRQKGPYNKLELEIKRRIWWHIASTDWIFAFISGYQTGTYMVHPHQMHVNLPSNADDNEITPSSCPDRPLTEPSEVTYFIFRCKLAVLFLEFLETVNRNGVELDEIDYDQVLAFDKKIGDFLKTLPYFLREENEGNDRYAEWEKSRRELDRERPYLKLQRVMAQFGACTRISRLHRPYLVLGARDPRYAYSRMVCLRSARVVLEVERGMRETISPASPDPSKVWAIAYQVFLATIILAMDFHLNRHEPRAEERTQEILECCRTLEEAASRGSIIAARGLKKLKEVMAKWGPLAGTDSISNNGAGKEPVLAPTESTPAKSRGYLQDANTLHGMEGGNAGGSWADSWNFNAVWDYSQWDGVFQDLDGTHGMF
ncbi:C6 zinc finger domain-containing protein [Arthroderma uncinatum]|uniref:C6 zinc finger domain-containing protein n=1 Tax=Arthroderma uncinatum TaxID=74035 RepID=UPI00144AD289|nr:C6 zinc finger domain-containing protein [Arthroderma uncinatum]KAF3482538.1 C6 zinc finger domain-containing protein [Arthroderma uncinatum]